MKSYRILIVDKEASFGSSLCRILEEAGAGYRTQCAASMREAREIAVSFKPHLVVTDVLLTDGDGCDLYTELRDENPQLPFLFLCAHDEEAARLRGLDFPPVKWLGRREAAEMIASRVESALSRAYDRG
ncbi:MAG: response regulator [Lachnospiraceae bacterium]|nr:response regulator [Lachnospiraceae bacterium]